MLSVSNLSYSFINNLFQMKNIILALHHVNTMGRFAHWPCFEILVYQFLSQPEQIRVIK